MSTPQETYDVSPTQRKVMLERAARREKLRHEYLQQIGNPSRDPSKESGLVFDSGIQRYLSMRTKRVEYFRPTIKSSLWYFGTFIAPTALIMYIMIGSKDREEERYRTGQVSYRDREYKFT